MTKGGLLWVLTGAAIVMLPATTLAATNVLFIFDASGSMKRTVESGQTRMTVAKRAMSAALKDMPTEARLGLMLYGHRRTKDCEDIEIVSPIGADDAGTLVRRIEALQPKGETPIAAALDQAARSFAALKGQNNQIVLVTDGIEECNGDPCAAVKSVVALGLGVKAHIVGFTLDDKQRAAIECITKETGGRYFAANNTTSLREAFAEVKKEVAQATPTAPPAPPKPAEFNLLAKPNGGQMLAAPFAGWDCLIAGADEAQAGKEACMYTHDIPSEAVFAFKDERPATFAKFTVLVPGSYGRNLKEFEILAGDDLTGEFRSLGQFQTQNLRLMKTPFQEFKFPEITARYVKFRVLSTHGDGPLYLYQIRLLGKLGDTAPATAATVAAPKSPATNLLAKPNGGQLLAAPAAEWECLISGANAEQAGKEACMYTSALPSEAIFAFKDERPATFNTFTVLIPNSYSRNLKEFEVLAGDDLTGEFRSLGQFHTQNVRLIKTPFQEFTLPETTAQYVKFRVLSTHGDGLLYLYQVQLLGSLK